ncbi:MAG TPA: threonylcarbamoyl-AMP synthase [Devosia sp.]|nr:threonylcarbamoyl-AMP synthase [Devosia sp.]
MAKMQKTGQSAPRPVENARKDASGKKEKPSIAERDRAVALLRAGKIVAFPTDTVFGLGVRADRDAAAKALFALKSRPPHMPLSVLCADMNMVRALVRINETARRLASLWPGALTLVLPLRTGASVSAVANAGLSSLGVRIPAHDAVRELIVRTGVPLATSSANRSGQPTVMDAETLVRTFGNDLFFLEGGRAPGGTASTILDVTGPQAHLLRAGGLSVADITARTGVPVVTA